MYLCQRGCAPRSSRFSASMQGRRRRRDHIILPPPPPHPPFSVARCSLMSPAHFEFEAIVRPPRLRELIRALSSLPSGRLLSSGQSAGARRETLGADARNSITSPNFSIFALIINATISRRRLTAAARKALRLELAHLFVYPFYRV